MFGTVARLSLKPGIGSRLEDVMREYDSLDIPGHIATYLYRLDDNPDECFLVTVWRDRDSYFANANSPEQDVRYRRMRDLLTSDPQWHDGDIIYSVVGTRSMSL